MSIRSRRRPSSLTVLCALVAVMGLLSLPSPSVAGAQESPPPSRTAVVDAEQFDSPSAFSVAISELAMQPPVDRVVIARDDDFADALASGVMQGTGPLLLVPGDDRVPAVVSNEIRRLGATEAVILGGTDAVGPQVLDDLTTLGLSVRRVFGPERITTAVAVAQEVPASGTVILARAYATADSPTTGFADAMASGGMAAEQGWPVLLTDGASLSGATRTELERLGVTDVLMVGGTAAISAAVEDEIATFATPRRIAGPERFSTAIEVAKENQAAGGQPVSAITLVEGASDEAWMGGFAAASLSATRDAPVVLGTAEELPSVTSDFLAAELGPDKIAGTDDEVMLCIINADVCEVARRDSGLPPAPLVTIDPPNYAYAGAGTPVTVTVDPPALADGRTLSVQGCLGGGAEGQEIVLSSNGSTVLTVPDYADADVCVSSFATTFENGESTRRIRELRDPPANLDSYIGLYVKPVIDDQRATRRPIAVSGEVNCNPAASDEWDQANWWLAGADDTPSGEPGSNVVDDMGFRFLRSQLPRTGTCTVKVTAPGPGVSVTGWRITGPVGGSADLASGPGNTATFDVNDYEAQFDTLNMRFTVRVADDAQPLEDWPGPVRNRRPVRVADDGVRVVCEDGTRQVGVGTFRPERGAACTATPRGDAARVRLVALNRSMAPAAERQFTAWPGFGPVVLVSVPATN